MTKKHVLLLIFCCTGMLSILFGLYAISPLTKEMYRGEFNRNFKTSNFIKQTQIIKLPFNSYYIAGSSNKNVYLGNWTNAFHMIKINLESLDSQHVKIKTDNISKYKDIEKFRLKVDSPYIYLTHGTIPTILRGTLTDLKANKFMNDSAFFADALPISRSSIILRSYSSSQKSFELAKETNDSTGFKYNYEILEKQNDGIFCVEGILNFNKKTNEIIYIYTYRNQYIVTDSSLNLKYRANTIDSFSHAPIQVANIESENSKMLTGLPNIVNLLSCTDEHYLFVKSNILAKNENTKSFLEGATFDVYDTNEGKYLWSFNLYNYNSKYPSGFTINKDKIIVMYGEHILIHTVNF
jgi:hypothetical protein